MWPEGVVRYGRVHHEKKWKDIIIRTVWRQNTRYHNVKHSEILILIGSSCNLKNMYITNSEILI